MNKNQEFSNLYFSFFRYFRMEFCYRFFFFLFSVMFIIREFYLQKNVKFVLNIEESNQFIFIQIKLNAIEGNSKNLYAQAILVRERYL